MVTCPFNITFIGFQSLFPLAETHDPYQDFFLQRFSVQRLKKYLKKFFSLISLLDIVKTEYTISKCMGDYNISICVTYQRHLPFRGGRKAAFKSDLHSLQSDDSLFLWSWLSLNVPYDYAFCIFAVFCTLSNLLDLYCIDFRQVSNLLTRYITPQSCVAFVNISQPWNVCIL